MPSQTRPIRIGKHTVSNDSPVFIVAELSGNHNGSIDRAEELVLAAKEAGADAVKLQTYTADTITMRCDRPEFIVDGGTIWDGRSLYDLYEEAHTPWEWHARLKQVADDVDLELFSAPFDSTAVDFLVRLGVPALKVASPELVDLPLIRQMAATAKPLILSTGMATLAEIEEAIITAKSSGTQDIVLLKCTSAYPAPPNSMNLSTIAALRSLFGLPVGLSDHTLGIEVPVAAVALGARVIEKHITLARTDEGPDSAFSLEPWEFRNMVRSIRNVEQAIGAPHFLDSQVDERNRAYRRSLFIVADMKPGEVFTSTNVRSIRPAGGLSPKHLPRVLGKTANCQLSRGEPLRWSHIAAVEEGHGDS